MKVKTTYYLDNNNEWLVEKDGDTYWFRAEEKGYQMVSRELLEALHTALGLLLSKEDANDE